MAVLAGVAWGCRNCVYMHDLSEPVKGWRNGANLMLESVGRACCRAHEARDTST